MKPMPVNPTSSQKKEYRIFCSQFGLKPCWACREVKSLEGFNARANAQDRKQASCRSCDNSKKKEWCKLNRERDMASKRDWTKAHPERVAAGQLRYRTANPEKRRARRAVSGAVLAGKMVRPDHCSECGAKCIPHGHHSNYDKDHWLDVEWLCSGCHGKRHRGRPAL